jgi:hypothetical protein
MLPVGLNVDGDLENESDVAHVRIAENFWLDLSEGQELGFFQIED